MRKLTRSVEAFARRIQMGQVGLYAIVEGRVTDRAFYDRLLRTKGPVLPAGYSIRLAEEITIAGNSAGGKPYAYKLFEHLATNKWLSQSNNQITQSVVFLLDRDFEHLSGTAIPSDHIIYTSAADAEAEIANNAKMLDAIETTYSLTAAQVRRAIPKEDITSELADIWRSWITLLVVAETLGLSIPGLHIAGLSVINQGKFGSVVQTEFDRIRLELEKSLCTSNAHRIISSKMSEVDAIFDSGKGSSLVKGKWVASFAHHKITNALADQFIQNNVHAASVFRAALHTVDFEGPWTQDYEVKLTKIASKVKS